jgi:hypothetical protein
MIRPKHHEREHNHYDSYHAGHRGSYHQGHIGPSFLMGLAESIIRNKTLLIVLIIASVVVAILGIWLVIKLVPWVLSLFGYVEQGGIKGIVDVVLRLMRTIWEGSGKG